MSIRSFSLAVAVSLTLLIPSSASAEGIFIPASGRTDMVHDFTRNRLYVSSGSEILRYELESGQFLAPLLVGGNLRGIDLAPFDDFLAVADESSSVTEVWFWLVDPDSGYSERVSIPRTHESVSGTWSVAFGLDDSVLVSTVHDNVLAPLWRWDRGTGQVSQLTASIGTRSMLAASGDADRVGVAEGGAIQNRRGLYYVSAFDLDLDANATYLAPNYEIGVDGAGGEIALPTIDGSFLLGADFVAHGTIFPDGSGRAVAASYHPVEPWLYAPWSGTSEVRIYDSTTLSPLGAFDAESLFSDVGSAAYGSGRTRLSRDGAQLFVAVDGGIRAIAVHAGLSAPNETVATAEDTPVAFFLNASIGSGGDLTAWFYPPLITGTPPNVTFVPEPDQNGSSQIYYSVQYGRASKSGLIFVEIAPVNDPPRISDQSIEIFEDSPTEIALDYWEDNDGPGPHQMIVLSPPLHGSLSGDPWPTTYTPGEEYSGPDQFTYKLSDGQYESTPATVSITVQPIDDAPVAIPQDLTTPEDTPVGITLTANDPEGGPLTFRLIGGPSHGALVGSAPNLTYLPAANYTGPDQFYFQVDDGLSMSSWQPVSIAVTPVNDPPTANPQWVSTAEDAPQPIAISGSDIEGSALTFAIAGAPGHGSLTGLAPNLTYTPAANYAGADAFAFTVSDGAATSAPATVSILVTAVNDAPIANGQALSTFEDTAKAIVLAGSDVEGSPLSFLIGGSPTHGTLSGSGANRTYTPSANYSGPDSFTFTVSDGQVTSAPATVSLAVTAVNDAPNAVNDVATTKKNTAVTILVLANDFDVDGNPLTVVSTTKPTKGGTVTILAGNTSVRFAPKANFTGTDTFTYTASDGQGGTKSATVTVTVTRN